MLRCPTQTVMASFHAVLVVLHENGKSSVSSSSAELRFTVGYDSALLQRRTFSLRVSCNVHGGLEPRQTVLHKVTSGTLRWPTVTLMVGSSASSRLLHEHRKNLVPPSRTGQRMHLAMRNPYNQCTLSRTTRDDARAHVRANSS